MKIKTGMRQRGLSLTGLIFILAILGLLAVLGMKIVPTFSEYLSVKKMIVKAKEDGTNPIEIQKSFDKQSDVNYVTSIEGKDLDMTRVDGGYEVSFDYEKRIPLVGPVSLVIEYQGSTASRSSKLPAAD